MFTWCGLNAFLHKLFDISKFFNNNNSNIFDKYVIIIDKNHIHHTHLKIFCKIKQFSVKYHHHSAACEHRQLIYVERIGYFARASHILTRLIETLRHKNSFIRLLLHRIPVYVLNFVWKISF